jgi:hypothetical protein
LQFQSLERLDAIAPRGWRCFVAFEDDRAIHHSFVAVRDEGPALFGVFTAEDRRCRGVFRAVVSTIGSALAASNEGALYSRVGMRNRQSRLAHMRAGFTELQRRYDPVLLGFDVRRLTLRALRWLGHRKRAAD